MRKTNGKKGITLVALVITIIILLILAGISISALTNTGIFQKAKDAKNASENAEKEQGQTLSEYERELNKYSAQEFAEDKMNKVLSKTENTFLKDKNENIFAVPAGFKVVVNNDTNNAKTVDKGIVIEDATLDDNGNATSTNGSQFVWVPVGMIKKDDGITVEINLDRYTFEKDGTPTAQGNKNVYMYYQELETSDTGNAVAKSITDFKNSVIASNGFYIGRYEARTSVERKSKDDELTQVTEKGTDNVYNYVTQSQAASQAQNMYKSSNFSSDLMNSYAWDTSTLFLQNCGDNNIPYSRQTRITWTFSKKGTNSTETKDVQCNIFDMASNVFEWTTETTNYPGCPCVGRGGTFGNDSFYTGNRDGSGLLNSQNYIGFRPLLFINI